MGQDSTIGRSQRSNTQGVVGQSKAAGVILEIVQEGRIAGRAMLFAGLPSTRKAANALAAFLASSIFTFLKYAAHAYYRPWVQTSHSP